MHVRLGHERFGLTIVGVGQWQADPLPKGDKRVFKLSQQDCDKISIHIWMRYYLQNVNTISKNTTYSPTYLPTYIPTLPIRSEHRDSI